MKDRLLGEGDVSLLATVGGAAGVGLGDASNTGGEGLGRLLDQLLGLVEVNRVDGGVELPDGQAPDPVHHEVLGDELVLPALVEGQPLQFAVHALPELIQQGLAGDVCGRLVIRPFRTEVPPVSLGRLHGNPRPGSRLHLGSRAGSALGDWLGLDRVSQIHMEL